jgi:hypothetical protein
MKLFNFAKYYLSEQTDVAMFNSNEKGKEKEPITLRVRMKWDGRYAQVDRAGLLMRPPGKMFKQELLGVPLTPEERDEVRSKAAPRRRSSAATTAQSVHYGPP